MAGWECKVNGTYVLASIAKSIPIFITITTIAHIPTTHHQLLPTVAALSLLFSTITQLSLSVLRHNLMLSLFSHSKSSYSARIPVKVMRVALWRLVL